MAESRTPAALVGWRIPDTVQTYTKKDTAFYALSVGVGQNPHNLDELALVDPWNGAIAALPSMALVLGYPGFWLGDPQVEAVTGVSPSQVLHGEQTLQLLQALPVEAEVIGQTQVTSLVDKGAGKGALLYSERAIRRVDNGTLLAVCRQVHFLRGCGGFGSAGDPPIDSHRASLGSEDALPVSRMDLPTRTEQALLYRLNGDSNPLHIYPAAASAAGFERPVFHGMGTIGVACHALVAGLANFNPKRIRGISMRMTASVFPGDTLRTEIWADGRFRTWALERNALVLDRGFCEVAMEDDA